MPKTIKDLGGYTGISKGMKFKNPNNQAVEFHEITSHSQYDSYKGSYGFEIKTRFNSGTEFIDTWYDFELNGLMFDDYELIEENSEDYCRPKPQKQFCWHPNKRPIIMFTSGYWFCDDCQEDLGTLTEREFYSAVRGLK